MRREMRAKAEGRVYRPCTRVIVQAVAKSEGVITKALAKVRTDMDSRFDGMAVRFDAIDRSLLGLQMQPPPAKAAPAAKAAPKAKAEAAAKANEAKAQAREETRAQAKAEAKRATAAKALAKAIAVAKAAGVPLVME